jgi:hypothetical protein
MELAQVCVYASRPVAKRCFSRLRDLIKAGYFREGSVGSSSELIDGAEHFAQGDYAGAVAHWRPLSGNYTALPPVASEAFDRAGDPETAEKLDEAARSLAAETNGASMAHVLSARRAMARGDKVKAKKLAQEVVDAWSVADAPVPAVGEMKALLKKLE